VSVFLLKNITEPLHFLDPEKITMHLSLSLYFFVVLNTNHLFWASAGGKILGAVIIADDAEES
jgi:hypothetical protein